MELLFRTRALSFLLSFWLLFSIAFSVEGSKGNSKVRGVNLGGWLVVEGWIKPSLFDGIPNGDMLDGTEVQFKSVTLQKYVCAENGGGSNVTVRRDVPSSWETFRLWRVSETEFQLRCVQGQFMSCDGQGSSVSATAVSPSTNETFYIERLNNGSRVHIKLQSGAYLQAATEDELTADYQGTLGWDDNAATFEMIIVSNNLHGDYQLANGYGLAKAKEVLQGHRNSFITIHDFYFLSRHGINTVRIPVGWWIAFDPNPPAPFIGGTLAALDNAFSWAETYNIKCIIDLHAAPGSQNGMEHSASRDGSTDWPTSQDYINETLHVIDFLASRSALYITSSFDRIFRDNGPSFKLTIIPEDKKCTLFSERWAEQALSITTQPNTTVIRPKKSRKSPIGPVMDHINDKRKCPVTLMGGNVTYKYAGRPALLGIELLNEPSAATVPLDVLVSYYQQGYKVVRKYSPNAYVILCQRIGNADPLELYQANIGSINTVVDLHYYNLFDKFFVNLSSAENIQFIYKSREAQLQQLNNASGPLVFIGEWVNEWNVTTGSQKEYQDFGNSQLAVYNAASFGWAYWTLKNDRAHWDFEWNIRNNYLQFSISPSRQISNFVMLLGLACSSLYFHQIL